MENLERIVASMLGGHIQMYGFAQFVAALLVGSLLAWVALCMATVLGRSQSPQSSQS
jgi:hypothetical protein